ncbi:MAG: 16S rRNA (adenine(1518)-N(6)/adenine(1519)-N(6))-dimethyltransferase RsmA [Myxococcota bacterium]
MADGPPRGAEPAKNAPLLAAQGLKAKKSFGQNFLEDQGALRRIAQLCQVRPDARVVVEIGAGLGALTAALVESGAHVLAVERDRDLVPILQDRFRNTPDVEILEANALTLDWPALHARHGTLTICGNLPYHLTSPLLFNALEHASLWRRLVVMVQKEVAERMAASPGNRTYGLLTVRLAARLNVQKAFDVPPGAFHPPPKVTSSVVLLTPRPDPVPGGELPAYPRVVKAAFAARRKTLRNGLKPILGEHVDEVLSQAGVDGKARAETLSPEQFGALARAAAPHLSTAPAPPDSDEDEDAGAS